MLDGKLAGARFEIDGVDVLMTPAIEAAEQLVFPIVAAVGPAALLRVDRHRSHVVVCKPDELLRRDAVFGYVVVSAVARFLDFLLRLQPGILVMPQDEIDLVLVGRVAVVVVAAGRPALCRW